MNVLTEGSLCTGTNGIGLALRQVFDIEPLWFADPDPGSSALLAHHYPHRPNYGDLTTQDWAAVAPVDVMTAGWPCQPWSHAGRRKGCEDARAIWPAIAAAVRHVRPRLLVLENVAAIVGAGELARVAGDLAQAGYVGAWRSVRASDVGAPHGRARVFVVAADVANVGHAWPGHARNRRPGPTHSGTPAADTAGERRREGRTEPARLIGRPDAAVSGDAPPADAGDQLFAAQPGAVASRTTSGQRPGSGADRRPGDRGEGLDWAEYGPAIERWERVLGRRVPAPTVLGLRGGLQLSPVFAEWLMGLPAGWVTGVPGLTRNQQLKLLGNGVVPQQCAAAVRHLLPLIHYTQKVAS
jgi:DNA (cytosine-5)-methyltransferase 1